MKFAPAAPAIFAAAATAFVASPLTAQPAAGAAAAQTIHRFSFGDDAALSTDRSFVRVSPDTVFSAANGYGFDLGTAPAADDAQPAPFYFSLAVPEGNYRVTVTLGHRTQETNTTIKAESRRLALEGVKTAPGEFVTRRFLVNVRNPSLTPPPLNAPGGTRVILNDREQGVLHWDDKLTLEFNGPHPAVQTLEIAPAADAITVFLAGDSTVTDQPREPAASWGQMLPRFFNDRVVIANHAESGETLKSFLTAHRLDKILSAMKPGDYLFIQFGHNDSKSQWPQTYVEPFTTYQAYLRVFIAEARRRGATPVLITSMHRRVFDERGKIKNTHGDYPDAVRQLAQEENVALIDLHALSATLYEALGPEKSPLAFNANGKDATHHNNYGAYELAQCVVAGIRAAKLPLADLLADDAPPLDPAKPDRVETFALPASPGYSTLKPRGD